MRHTKIRKGDQVMVIAGNDRGKSGVVLLLKNDRIVVEGINVRVKNIKKSQQNPKGKRIDIESPIHISNVMLMVNNQPVRPKIRDDGRKELWGRSRSTPLVFCRVIKERKDSNESA
ncbi:50S ribosomal protein L24 [Candidatus Clavichlamydia salmonicola]|uniref:50S ribosomal protein L24 n=1 Tax=Candidatus Clavichlamydia salmonicola TaxID=469812 RepID=UPI001890C22F|nr:50S ribosomal protein L24 [Candidatus Clavichlamydia salmonicola]